MKLQYLLSLIVLVCLSQNIRANQTTKYVWALNGLNLRSTPDENGKIISIIPYGDSVQLTLKTQSQFEILYIDSLYKGVIPLHLAGTWVKVKYNKILGFVFEPFLLEIPCARQNETMNEYCLRMSERFPFSTLKAEYTVYHGGNPGLMVLNCYVTKFSNGQQISFYRPIPEVESSSDTLYTDKYEGFSESFYLKGFTTQELLVILHYFYMSEKGREYSVYENNANSISMTDNSTQTINIWLYNDEVIIFSFFDAGC